MDQSIVELTNVIKNGSFENNNWMTTSNGNQIPVDWKLNWLEPGIPLYDTQNPLVDQATHVPECVHKHDWQLPPNEQIGQPDALIIHGTNTYKMFASGKFGVELIQHIVGLKPGTSCFVEVPAIMDIGQQGANYDPYGAEFGVWIYNGQEISGQWMHAGEVGHRKWRVLEAQFTVPESGEVYIRFRGKSKWLVPVAFFVDSVNFYGELDSDPDPDPEPEDKLVIEIPPNISTIELVIQR